MQGGFGGWHCCNLLSGGGVVSHSWTIISKQHYLATALLNNLSMVVEKESCLEDDDGLELEGVDVSVGLLVCRLEGPGWSIWMGSNAL